MRDLSDSNNIKPNMDMYTLLCANSKGSNQFGYLTRWWITSLFAVMLMLHFAVPSVDAQTTQFGDIQGTVLDKKRGEPLVSHPVTLTIHKADALETQETSTDENGNYRFENLPLNPSLYYTVSTLHEETNYTETDLVLSTWAPNLKIDFEIGAFTDDSTQVRVKSHSFIIAPPPPDHAPDGAVTIIEAIGIENLNELPFRTTHGTRAVGFHLNLPKGTEGFQPHRSANLTLDIATNQAVLTTPLPPGETQLGYTYIFHVEKNELDLSRRLNFDTTEFLFFVPEGIDFVPSATFFGAPRREQIHNSVYLIYQSTASQVFAGGTTPNLGLNVNTGVVRGNPPRQTSNLGQLVLIAVAAALTGGFFVAALFKLRTVSRKTEPEMESSVMAADAGWLRKLSSEDIEHVRVARLEFITHLDDKYEKQGISERVYKRLRREQTERLTTLLEAEKGENDA